MKKLSLSIIISIVIGNTVINSAENNTSFNPYRFPERHSTVDYSNKNITCVTTPEQEDSNFILWYGADITVNALNLSNNHINYLPSCLPFRCLYRLQALDLSHNLITEIAPLTFANPNMHKLDLSNNNMTKLPSLAGNDLLFLSELDLSANQINDISEAAELMKNVANLSKLNLTNNPLSESDILSLRESFPDIEILF